jgi:hypothetical protein
MGKVLCDIGAEIPNFQTAVRKSERGFPGFLLTLRKRFRLKVFEKTAQAPTAAWPLLIAGSPCRADSPTSMKMREHSRLNRPSSPRMAYPQCIGKTPEQCGSRSWRERRQT